MLRSPRRPRAHGARAGSAERRAPGATLTASSRPTGAALGLLADRLLGEPPAAWHPVARFGQLMTRTEQALWRDDRAAGAAYALSGAVVGAAAGRSVGSTTIVTAVAVAGRELRRVAAGVGSLLSSGRLADARLELSALVGRNTSTLEPSGVAAAVIESLAENSVDAVFAPALWAAVGGAPAVAAYRAINTMDAMVGHRCERYASFGWAAARLDDVANWIPARLFALTLAASRPRRAGDVWRVVRQQAPAHPSPNAGVAEAAMAAVLGRELGGPLRYGARHEERPRLGRGPRPEPSDIASAIAAVDRAEWLLTASLVVAGALAGRQRR